MAKLHLGRNSRRIAPALLLLILAAAFLLGSRFRTESGVEWSPESLRAYVHGLGVAGPLIFVAFVTFRNFLLLPSLVVLTAGGLLFGAVVGTALGGLGILCSALVQFAIARVLGREWVRSNLGKRMEDFERRIEAAGPLVIGVSTAHPMGPMSPFHWGAGLSSIAWAPFLLAVAIAGPIRAAAYSIFGANLLDAGSWAFWGATVGLLALTLLPLLHPRIRQRIFWSGRVS